MPKSTLALILLFGIILAACGQQVEQAPEVPTVVPTDTTEPATTTPAETTEPPTLEETVEAEPTATEIPPDNAPGCINRAAFVTDVTIPDHSKLSVGEAFTKIWRVQNTGTCIWWSGYTLSHYSEQTLSAPEFVVLPRTNPGETADISVDLVAPSLPGTYRGNFVIKNPVGLIMQVDNDSRLWLIIDVVTSPSTGETSGTCVPTPDAALAEQVATAINSYRTQNSLTKYTLNTQLAQAAQAHANDMACNQLFSHDGSDGSTSQTRVAASGYAASGVTENVYGSYPPLNPDQVVNWWKFDQADPNHNLNLLSTKYTEFGVAYAFYNSFGYYVVVLAVP